MSEFSQRFEKTFYNIFPKSGTHLVKQHRGVPKDNHVSLRLGLTDSEPTPQDYIKFIKKMKGDFTGHVPVSDPVLSHLRRNNIRTVFVFRDLWDVAASLAWYVTNSMEWRPAPEMITEFNYVINGTALEYRDDPLMDCIGIVARWWANFKPWVYYADTIFTYEELRPAAFLCGDENSITFHNGNINGWVKVFDQHHIKLAENMLPKVISDYRSGRLLQNERVFQNG